MTDRVQVLKQEQAALGGDGTEDVEWPEPIDPQEDVIEARGIYFQDEANRDETTLISRDDDDMTFKDGNNPTSVTLTDLLENLPTPTCCGQVLMCADGLTFSPQLPLTSCTGGWLVNDSGYLLVVG